MKNNIITYSLISFLVISFFGFNFIISILGNILILLFLTPILLLVLGFLGLNSFKSRITVCENCGSSSLTNSKECLYCGSEFNYRKDDNSSIDASKETIEIDAEEVK